MSATLSEQVESLKQQTDLLRASAGKLVGQDLTNYNIGNIASAIDGVTPEPEEAEGYVRPSWYPNVEEILNNAPVIVKDGKTYTPCVGALYLANEVTTAFYKAGNTSTSTAVNYYNCTGCDAYIFGDVVQNNIANANETTLEVGTEINHKWNEALNITNPDPLDTTGDAVRWAIWYSSNTAAIVTPYIHGNWSLVELFIKNLVFNNDSFRAASSVPPKCPIKYLKIFNSAKWVSYMTSVSGDGVLSDLPLIEEIIMDCDLAFQPSYSTQYGNQFSSLYNLKKIEFNGGVKGTPQYYFLSACNSLSSIKFPQGMKSIPNSFLSNSQIKSIVVPDTVEEIRSYAFSASTEHIIFNSSLAKIEGLSSSLNNLKEIIIPDNVTQAGSIYIGRSVKKFVIGLGLTALTLYPTQYITLDYLKIPLNITSISDSYGVLSMIRYVELYDNFDISGTKFYQSSSTYSTLCKPLQWLKDLCGWLKDRTGETANTMVLGTANLANANQIFLTFDPNNKRNITWVDEGTEGAISITEFITNQLNWTLS